MIPPAMAMASKTPQPIWGSVSQLLKSMAAYCLSIVAIQKLGME